MFKKQPEVDGKIETQVEISGTGWDFEVTATVWYRAEEYNPGRRSGPPELCYPPEGGGIEVLEVQLDAWEKHDHRFENDVTKEIKAKIKESAEIGNLADEIQADAAEQIDTYKEMAAEAKQGRLLHAPQ